MAKLAAAKKIGVPVPDVVAPDVTHLVAYFGPAGFVPSYAQLERIELPIASVERQTKDGVEYFVFDTSTLPATFSQEPDLYFTLEDANDKEEGDFSPLVHVPLDREPPVALGQPVLLD